MGILSREDKQRRSVGDNVDLPRGRLRLPQGIFDQQRSVGTPFSPTLPSARLPAVVRMGRLYLCAALFYSDLKKRGRRGAGEVQCLTR